MSTQVVRQAANRIVEHSRSHHIWSVDIIFHGGEPLIGGITHLQTLVQAIEEEFKGTGVTCKFGMQSNGLLFDEEIGDFCLDKKIRIGISIDGPPEINDLHRVDKRGRGSSERLHAKLSVLSSERFRAIFNGFLVVINPEVDPGIIIDYLMKFSPGSIDFLLPYDNHDRRPPGKAKFDSTEYGDWLIQAFDYWYSGNVKVRVRLFDSMIRLLLGEKSLVESVGNEAVSYVVVESNGDLEALDSLKACYEGATSLGLNIFANTLDDAARHFGMRARHLGAESLSERCRNCALLEICGGGYLPNRYSKRDGFINPSVFCFDLSKIIYHIHDEIGTSLATIGPANAA